MMKREQKSRSVKYSNKFWKMEFWKIYYSDDATTGNNNQPKEDSTQKHGHGDTTAVGEHDQTTRGNGIFITTLT